MRRAPFDALLWISTWGSLLNSIPAKDTHLPSDTGSLSSPGGEHWQGMGREREERQELGILTSPKAIGGFSPHQPWPSSQLQNRYSFPFSSAGALEMGVCQLWSEKGKEPGRRALQTLLGHSPLGEEISPLWGHRVLPRGVLVGLKPSSVTG